MFFNCFKSKKVDDGEVKFTKKQLEKWQKECLIAHNKYRAKHGVKSLKLSKTLNAFANEWANHLADNNLIKHRDDNNYGENIAHGFGISYTAEYIVERWYEEKQNYNFQEPGFSLNAGHFTQIVWKNTTQLGVGVVVRNNSIWVVCNYDPCGNVQGQFLDCVPPTVEDTISSLKRASKRDTKPEAVATKTKRSAKDTKNWSEFELDCLDSHNTYRAHHGCPELILNRKLCDYATEWAKNLAKRRTLQHRSDNKYGENLYYCMNFEPSAEDCVKSWYDEIEFYNFSNPGFSGKTGHFTAVIWKDTTEMGVGKATIDSKTYIVCNYSPAGNVLNYFKDQVPPPLSGKKPSSGGGKKPKRNNDNSSLQEISLDGSPGNRIVPGSPVGNYYTSVNVASSSSASGWTKTRTTKMSYTITSSSG